MPRRKKTVDISSSPDPLELLPPPRFSPFRRNPNSPHKQLQLRLLELNADIADDRVTQLKECLTDNRLLRTCCKS
jgi:hypothetical protein